MQTLSDGFSYTVLSKYSRVHPKMSADELLRRLDDALTTELDSSFEKVTFIYSGHGWRNGLAVNNDIIEYKELVRTLLVRASTVRECRIILDCCYASSFASFAA